MGYLSRKTIAHVAKSAVAVTGLFFLAFAADAQEAEDGVLRTCLAQDNSSEICICASLVLHARLGDENYARFGEISDRIAAITAGAEGDLDSLTSEGFRYFVPHGQAIAVCREKIAARE